MRKKTEDIDKLACAFLASEGKNQVQIAERLKISQATISRLIVEAQNEGYLVRETKFVRKILRRRYSTKCSRVFILAN